MPPIKLFNDVMKLKSAGRFAAGFAWKVVCKHILMYTSSLFI